MRVSGLKNCDTTRKALKELADAGKDVTFRDLRADPPGPEEVARAWAAVGEALLNRASTTWRGLSEDERSGEPLALLSAHPTLIKRPLIEAGGTITAGWGPRQRAAWLG